MKPKIKGIIAGATILGAIGAAGLSAYLGRTQKDYAADISSLAKNYENPKIIIGYDRWNNVSDSFSPNNSLPAPSIGLLNEELKSAENSKDYARVSSIRSAIDLAKICESNNIPYGFASLSRDSGYDGMLQRESFPTALVYCLPQVDHKMAERIEKGHEHVWKGYNKPVDVKSFHAKDNKLEEIVWEGKK